MTSKGPKISVHLSKGADSQQAPKDVLNILQSTAFGNAARMDGSLDVGDLRSLETAMYDMAEVMRNGAALPGAKVQSAKAPGARPIFSA